MSDLVAFVGRMLDADEAAARYATTRDALNAHDIAGWWYGHCAHYLRHDPARVLAGVAAKRRVVELHAAEDNDPFGPICRLCADSDGAGGLVGEWPCDTLKALASEWAGADGWDEGWAL